MEKVGRIVDVGGENPSLAMRGDVVGVVGPVSPPAPAEFAKSRLRHEYSEEDITARDEVGQWFLQCLDLAAGCCEGGLELRRKDFDTFVAATSFRFYTSASDVWRFQHGGELSHPVAEYLQKLTGRRFFDLPQPRGRWSFFKGEWSVSKIEEPLRRWAVGRSFCRTRDGRMGFVPRDARTGDKIYQIRGHTVPYVLRENGARYIAVGECYFDDFSRYAMRDVDNAGGEELVLV